MQAPRIEAQTLPPPPGIIGSLRTGFDVIATHVSVILLPLGLDLLLWLGPHLSMERLAPPVLQETGSQAIRIGVKPEDVQKILDAYKDFFHDFNLLGILRTFPIGIPSLMSGGMPTQAPVSAPMFWQINAPETLLGLIFLLTLVGWILGALYFRWVAALVTVKTAAEVLATPWRVIVQTLLYSLIWWILGWIIGLPLAAVLIVLFVINSWIGEGALLLLGFMSIWLIVPIFFSPHGMFMKKQNALASILGSFHLTRFTLPSSSLFVLTVILLGLGLNILWSRPTSDSWLTLVGIFGHAFITTALLASSFVYYRDMTSWLQTALERLRAGLPPQQA
jgi:hypothetical protein